MSGILERIFQSVACLCGLYKEVAGVTPNSSCTARPIAAIPDRHLTVIPIWVQMKPYPLFMYAVCGNMENPFPATEESIPFGLMLFAIGHTDCGHPKQLSDNLRQRPT